jgi:hypothetical protein
LLCLIKYNNEQRSIFIGVSKDLVDSSKDIFSPAEFDFFLLF